MLKKSFIKDILTSDKDRFEMTGWIKDKRCHKKTIFVDLIDSTGSIQLVASGDQLGEKDFNTLQSLKPESAITCRIKKENAEFHIESYAIIAIAKQDFTPKLRADFDIFDEKFKNHLLNNRHLYIRNPKIMAILRFRHILMHIARGWFDQNGFTEITAPILTTLPLYADATAISFPLHGQKTFLTQCVGFYLESAVHAFERVYNMGPSFRGEESRSKRHLTEYWHIKAELAFGDLEDIIGLTESFISDISKLCKEQAQEIEKILGVEVCQEGTQVPYPRISYIEAIERLKKKGVPCEFGTSLGSLEEEKLSEDFNTPFWIVGNPRSVEPFPYVIDEKDPRLTKTADLIATRGYGELLGVAEKISDYDMLKERMHEKGKLVDSDYSWVLNMRNSGFVPHIGFGIGLERFIRWLLDIPHVRDAIPFPRTFGRKIYP